MKNNYHIQLFIFLFVYFFTLIFKMQSNMQQYYPSFYTFYESHFIPRQTPVPPRSGTRSLTCHMTQFERSDWLRSEHLTNIMIEYSLHDRPCIPPWIKHFSHARVTIVWSLRHHQQSIVTSSSERKPSEWDTGSIFEDCRFNGIYRLLMSCKK